MISSPVVEPLGARIRRQRKRLGLTLDELSGRTGISKPYLSLIETGRISNPPSDAKVRQLEQTLGFPQDELVSHAHLQRTPTDVRIMLNHLVAPEESESTRNPHPGAQAVDADTKPLNTVLKELVKSKIVGLHRISTHAVPLIKQPDGKYPENFQFLSPDAEKSNEFVVCPRLDDPNAFAVRVCGDSMLPKFADGDIVIFSPALTTRNGDDCFVIFKTGKTTFRRIFYESDLNATTTTIRLQPRNERHRPTILGAGEFPTLYRAVYQLQRIDGD